MRLFPSFTASLLAAALLSATPARAQQGMHIDTAQPDFTAWAHFGGA